MQALLRVVKEYCIPLVGTGLCVIGVVLNCVLSHSARGWTAGHFVETAHYSVAPLHLESAALSGRGTLVVAIKYGCSHCERDMPFYKMLVTREQKKTIHSHVVFVAPDTTNEMREMIGPAVGGDHLVSDVPLSWLGVSGTPTLLFVDPNGMVTKVWVGEVSTRFQSDVLSELR